MHRDARPRHDTIVVARSLAPAVGATPHRSYRWLRRAAAYTLLLIVLPVFLIGLAVALPIGLLVGGSESVSNAWRAMRTRLSRL